MSEYQYYEFRTTDRTLTATEISELRQLSSRAEITSTSFINTYSYGDFRGNPDRLIERYFDLFVYAANWGTRHLMVRLPVRGIDIPTLEAYAGGGFSWWVKDEFAILSFQYSEDGGGEWEDGERWMPDLAPLRDELLNGDLRPLYLGWLAGVESGIDCAVEPDEVEPPVPSGLGSLTVAQSGLVEFLRIDADLLKVAAERSEEHAVTAPTKEQLAVWLKSRSAVERDRWLFDLLGESGPATRSEVLLQFRQSLRKKSSAAIHVSTPRRTCEELQAAAEESRQRAIQQAAEMAAKLRNTQLDQLARNIESAWREVQQCLDAKKPSLYDLATRSLKDLRDLAERDGQLEPFQDRLRELVRRHATKKAFIEQLQNAGLKW
ncbi:MAG: hypothetical protein NT069_28635 [Planctomycetota bacterium]|nr:hypothetical protein [Planctomycetota bacterium]